MGRGRAIYTLDESGVVDLEYHQRGSTKRFSGAIPRSVSDPTPKELRGRALGKRILMGYVVLLLVGFALGVALSGGTLIVRLAWGALGLFVAMLLVALLAQLLNVGLAVRHATRHNENSTD